MNPSHPPRPPRRPDDPRRAARSPAPPGGAVLRGLAAAALGVLVSLPSPGPLAAQPSGGEDCVGFSPGDLALDRAGGTWILRDGSHSVMRAGDSRDEARDVLRVVRHYGLDQQCFVGRPDPSMQYFLAGGRAPSGILRGEDCLAFRPERLRVVQADGRWKVAEGKSWLLDFGDAEGEARTAHRVIRSHGFEHMCFVGRPDASMTYFKAPEGRGVEPRRRDRPDPPERPERPDRPERPERPDGPERAERTEGPGTAGLREDCVAFDADRLEVARAGRRWKIIEGKHALMDFGDAEGEARRALRIIRARGFGHMCYVGRPDPSMTYFIP